ncbi:MAG: type III-A CRISPR-associated RAMP protein Csm3 [Bdellovibrionota bacterium]
MQLKEIKEYTGTIELKSGLHIGAGDVAMHIGGTDSPVIKNSKTGKPYIPGSSLKGKIRSLLELKTSAITSTNGKPLGHNFHSSVLQPSKNDDENRKKYDDQEDIDLIIELFGAGADSSDKYTGGPTRLIFSDCNLAESNDEENLYEVKAENSINRIKGTAENPRFIERVVAGVKFKFNISLKIFSTNINKGSEEDNQEDKNKGDGDKGELNKYEKKLIEGIALLEKDALGASGSRGYGKVEFTFDDENMQNKLSKERKK